MNGPFECRKIYSNQVSFKISGEFPAKCQNGARIGVDKGSFSAYAMQKRSFSPFLR